MNGSRDSPCRWVRCANDHHSKAQKFTAQIRNVHGSPAARTTDPTWTPIPVLQFRTRSSLAGSPSLCSSSHLGSSKSFCSSRLLPSAAPSYWTCRRRSSGYWYRSIQFCALARPPRIPSNKWIRPSPSQATFVPLIQTQNPTCRKSQQGPAWMHPIFRMLVSTSNSSSIPESIVNLARANK
jgi:hypothetical protein